MNQIKRQAGVFCLNQGWRFSMEDHSVLPEKKTHDTVYELTKSGSLKGPAASGYDDSGWLPVSLPHDWAASGEFSEDAISNHGSKARGTGWYRLRFCLEPEDCSRRIYLYFEGMSADAVIYMNGLLVKRNFSGYNSFSVDISDCANYGITPNILTVQINASSWEGWWYEGAGIYRNVWLIKKAPVHISEQGVFLKPEKVDGGWTLSVETDITCCHTECRGITLTHQIYAPDGTEAGIIRKELSSCKNGEVHDVSKIEIPAPVLWDIESPVLYTVHTSVEDLEGELDFQENIFGLRTIRFDAQTGFWLNGKNLKLKGFCNHQDHTGVGVAVPYSVKEFRIQKLQKSGANAYRCAHNPDPDILEICDRLGMLVMEENRIFSSEEENLRGLAGVVKRARNHPCVILYSLGNEEFWFGNEKGRKIAQSMAAVVKVFDETRPITAAFSGGFLEPSGAVEAVDVVGINYNELWYDSFRKQFPDKPVFGSETVSAYAVRGVYENDAAAHLLAGYDREKAAWGAHVRDMWQDICSRPYMAGTFAWTGFDYRGEPSPFQWPSVASFFGAWDSCGFAKDAAYIYQALWSKKPMARILSPWADRKYIGKDIDVMVATNGDFVKLWANDKLAAEGPVNPYRQFTCTIPCAEGELRAESYCGGALIAKDMQRTAGDAAKLRVFAEQESGTQADAAIFRIEVQDAEGNLSPEADMLLHFVVENGEIIGVGNGDPNSHEPDIAAFRHAFHGLAQVIVALTGRGPVRLTATSEGLASDSGEVFLLPYDHVPSIAPVAETVVDGWRFCSRIFDEKPSGSVELEVNDMNSYMPVSFNNQPPRELMFQKEKYGLYAVQPHFSDTQPGDSFYFQHINGSFWVYVDGTLIQECAETNNGPSQVMLPAGLTGDHIVTVIVQNTDHEHPFAGICSPVFYRKGTKNMEGAKK